ncbi:MAG: hypothetical protein SV775_02175 [Thermodesulfobacteriota bacterium]|nr:hypothetical protein [Thermodesulfobacteriota bacterium]
MKAVKALGFAFISLTLFISVYGRFEASAIDFTVNYLENGGCVWESPNKEHYFGCIADREGELRVIVTEVDLSSGNKSLVGLKRSFMITGHDQFQQVVLVPKIVEGKAVPMSVALSDCMGTKEICLLYYLVGDKANFAGKDITLVGFDKGDGIWKAKDSRFYTVDVSGCKGEAEYVLKGIKPEADFKDFAAVQVSR